MTPISLQQLQFHLGIADRRVSLVEQMNGFSLQIHHTEITHVLHAQRNHVRLFKCITRAAQFLRQYEVGEFVVTLPSKPDTEDAEDLIGIG